MLVEYGVGTEWWMSNAGEVRVSRRSVRVGYYDSQVLVVTDCGGEVTRAYRGVKEGVAIECGV